MALCASPQCCSSHKGQNDRNAIRSGNVTSRTTCQNHQPAWASPRVTPLAVQSADKAGAWLRAKARAALTDEASRRHRPMTGKRRDRVSAALRSWLTRERLSIVVRPKPRQCSWHSLSRSIIDRRRSSGARCRGAGCFRADCSGRRRSSSWMYSTGRLALGALKAFMLLTEAPAGSFTRCLLNLNSHNHNQHAGRPCFSLAVLIERSTSTPRYDIVRLRNRASHVSADAIHAHVEGSSLHRSTTPNRRAPVANRALDQRRG